MCRPRSRRGEERKRRGTSSLFGVVGGNCSLKVAWVCLSLGARESVADERSVTSGLGAAPISREQLKWISRRRPLILDA